jgi:hypothetical protein
MIFTLLTTTVAAQDVQLGKEELKNFRSFEGSQINFEYDDYMESYIYVTQELSKASVDITQAQVKLRSYIKLLKDGDDFCFGNVAMALKLQRQGEAVEYNNLQVLIGFTSNIKKGDAVQYDFDLESDRKGNSTIESEEVAEFLAKAIEMKRPLTFNFFNADTQLASMMIAYAKVTQKLGGILKTRDNLYKKYVNCQD